MFALLASLLKGRGWRRVGLGLGLLGAVFLLLSGPRAQGSLAQTAPQVPGGPSVLSVTPSQAPAAGTIHKVGSVNLAALPHRAAAQFAPASVPGKKQIPFRSVAVHRGAGVSAAAQTAVRIPTAPDTPVSNASGVQSPSLHGRAPQSRFNLEGISAVDSENANAGLDLTPPDEGVCASQGYVMNLVNDAGIVYSSSGGALTAPFSLYSFFNEQFPNYTAGTGEGTIGDARCQFDAATGTWFASELAVATDGSESHIDLAVDHNASPLSAWTIYQIPTTNVGGDVCPCVGDQPLLGVDPFLVTLQTNQYNLTSGAFEGGAVFLLSKKDLIAGSAVTFFPYALFTCSGTPCGSFQPASNLDGHRPAKAMYLVGSFDPNGTSSSTVIALAFSHEDQIDAATPVAPTVSSYAVSGQTYAFPVSAQQWGSPNPLSADDDRMTSAWNAGGTLWASLDTAVNVSGDSATRDGVAWWALNPQLDPTSGLLTGLQIVKQGIVATKGENLLYPAITAGKKGQPVMALSMTGQGVFPSAAYSVGSFETVSIFGLGSAADADYSCSLVTPTITPCRWGDYSAVAAVPGSNVVVVAANYVNAAQTAFFTNWDNRLALVPNR